MVYACLVLHTLQSASVGQPLWPLGSPEGLFPFCTARPITHVGFSPLTSVFLCTLPATVTFSYCLATPVWEKGKTQPYSPWVRGDQMGVSGLTSWLSGKEPACQYKKHKKRRMDPWVGKTLWRRKWQPTPVCLPGKFHGQRSLVGYSPYGCKELDTTEHHHQIGAFTSWKILKKRQLFTQRSVPEDQGIEFCF